MIVPINLHPQSISSSAYSFPPALAQFGSDELILIELQGSLEVEGESARQTVGTLSVDSATKKPTLRIGHHLLEGKLVNLQKPIAVLYRAPPTEKGNEDDSDSPIHNSLQITTKPPQSWDITTVVKRKMVFAERPMPMVAKAPGVSSVGVGLKKLG